LCPRGEKKREKGKRGFLSPSRPRGWKKEKGGRVSKLALPSDTCQRRGKKREGLLISVIFSFPSHAEKKGGGEKTHASCRVNPTWAGEEKNPGKSRISTTVLASLLDKEKGGKKKKGEGRTPCPVEPARVREQGKEKKAEHVGLVYLLSLVGKRARPGPSGNRLWPKKGEGRPGRLHRFCSTSNFHPDRGGRKKEGRGGRARNSR